ncbi:radical SAM protein [Candidatus Neomarinimicrobiota bacterium]
MIIASDSSGPVRIKYSDDECLLFFPRAGVFAKTSSAIVDHHNFRKSLEDQDILRETHVVNQQPKGKIVVLNITNQCNMSCVYCWANANLKNKTTLLPNIAVNIVKTCQKKNEIERIGEPTVNFATIRAVADHYKDLDYNHKPIFYITTNGVLDEKIREWLLNNRFAFTVSWDGIGTAHDGQRLLTAERSTAAQVQDTIQKISNTTSLLKVRMTVTNSSLPSLMKSIAWLNENGVKYIQIEVLKAHGRGREYAIKGAPDIDAFIEQFYCVVEFAEKHSMWILNSNIAGIFAPRDYYCSALKRRIVNVNPDGSISNCYKAQSRNNGTSRYFIAGKYHKDGKEILIDPKVPTALNNLNSRQYSQNTTEPIDAWIEGNCPYDTLESLDGLDRQNANGQKLSKRITERALKVIFKSGYNRVCSPLEGYYRFYKELKEYNHRKYFSIPKMKTEPKRYTIKVWEQEHSVDILGIANNGSLDAVEIDSCDICI